MLSERLRNLEPRLRSSKAFLSSDFRLNHSIDTPIIFPVKKTSANLNQRWWPSARRLVKASTGHSAIEHRRGYTARIRENVFLQPVFEGRRNHWDQQKTPNPKQKLFKPFGHRGLLVGTFVADGYLFLPQQHRRYSGLSFELPWPSEQLPWPEPASLSHLRLTLHLRRSFQGLRAELAAAGQVRRPASTVLEKTALPIFTALQRTGVAR